MSICLAPLDAYRADHDHPLPLAADDGVWLHAATLAARAVRARPAERAGYLAPLAALLGVSAWPWPAATSDVTIAHATAAVLEALVARAVQMEDAARLRLGIATLDAVLALSPPERPEHLERAGRALAYQARMYRALGEHAEAARRYASVATLGEIAGDHTLLGRAWAGLGCLAANRGNAPEARRLFEQVLATAGVAAESRQVAHHGLMMCAGEAGNLAEAARHAFHAWEEAAPTERPGALCNLAETLLRAGHPRAALAGFTAVLADGPLPRHELAAVGGVAVAGGLALPGAEGGRLLDAALRRVRQLIRTVPLPLAHAVALLDLAQAAMHLGRDDDARAAASEAGEIATRYRYFALAHRAEAFLAGLDAVTPTVTAWLGTAPGAVVGRPEAPAEIVATVEALAETSTAVALEALLGAPA